MFKTKYVNELIVTSIPIDKALKRFLVKRFVKMCDSNGPKYASDVFKTARELCLEYRADPSRIVNLRAYVSRFPISQKGWVKKIFMYMDCRPYDMLDLMKLYVGVLEPVMTPERSAGQQSSYLKKVASTVDTRVPGVLEKWLWAFGRNKPYTREQYLLLQASSQKDSFEYAFICGHSYKEYLGYYHKWFGILRKVPIISDTQASELIDSSLPKPEMYKDFNPRTGEAPSFNRDVWQASVFLNKFGVSEGWFEDPTLHWRSIDFMEDYICQHPLSFRLNEDDYWSPEGVVLGMFDGECVGRVHHIPKKGTVKRRPIAVPNRILQSGMVPIWEQLRLLLQRMPQDATFNQAKFDERIVTRVSNSSLYIGCVDLSQATDNLPLQWGAAIVDILLSYKISGITAESWSLFKDMASARWLNGDAPVRWTVGQPLGTLPSFNLLGLTHNLLLEALSFANGMAHSPYYILGDDLVVTNKKVRKAYIRLMRNARIPLSLHKSYEGNLVEFAGKVFIRRQIPAYSSDHTPIYWSSLFDYQRATGVKIGFRDLPKGIRSRLSKVTRSSGLPEGEAARVYKLAQLAELSSRGSLNHPLDERMVDCLADYYVRLDSEDLPPPDPRRTSGIVRVSGHPVTIGDYGYANKHGHMIRFEKCQLPKWYKEKFRPHTTDKIIRTSASTIKALSTAGSIKGDLC